MDYKFNGALNEFFASHEGLDDDELEKELQKFIEKYNDGEIHYENIALYQAYELLDEAQYTKSKKKAKELAKEAYEVCPDCFDAVIYLAQLEENNLKRKQILDEGLEYEKNRLMDEGYFDKDNIGNFYGIFETRPYMRGLSIKVYVLVSQGKIKLAEEVCKEILRLNEKDNLGIRFLLAAIYAYFEDENSLLSLHKKYPDEQLSMLFPLLVLYYKLEQYDKAKEYLDKINKNNKHFLKLFKGTLKSDTNVPEGYYGVGDVSEVMVYFRDFQFLMYSIPCIDEFILENSKKSKK